MRNRLRNGSQTRTNARVSTSSHGAETWRAQAVAAGAHAHPEDDPVPMASRRGPAARRPRSSVQPGIDTPITLEPCELDLAGENPDLVDGAQREVPIVGSVIGQITVRRPTTRDPCDLARPSRSTPSSEDARGGDVGVPGPSRPDAHVQEADREAQDTRENRRERLGSLAALLVQPAEEIRSPPGSRDTKLTRVPTRPRRPQPRPPRGRCSRPR